MGWNAVPADKKGKPKTRSNARSLRIKQRVVIGLLFAAAVSGPLSCMTVSKIDVPKPVAPAPFPTQVISFATLVAKDYLAGRPTQMPTAKDVDPSFGLNTGTQGHALDVVDMVVYSVTSRAAAYEAGTKNVYTTTFRVRTGEGLFDLAITTTADGSNLTVLAAAPSLIRSVVAQNATVAAPDYENVTGKIDIGPLALASVTKWADAFAANNAEDLKLAVNAGADGGVVPDGIYIGLGGFKVTSVAMKSLVVRADGLAYGRVHVVFQSTGANGFISNNEYDLLLTRVSSNDPRVVAWGVPGSGPTLRPFENNTKFQPTT